MYSRALCAYTFMCWMHILLKINNYMCVWMQERERERERAHGARSQRIGFMELLLSSYLYVGCED